MSETTNQVNDKKLNPPNPTGKGGFKDNPQNRNDGYWNSSMSISFQYKRFLKMTDDELKEWASSVSTSERTVAMTIAYGRIVAARKSLNDVKEITDRTEGKSPQFIGLGDVDEYNKILVEFIGDDNESEQS